MARTLADLPTRAPITDYTRLRVMASAIQAPRAHAVPAKPSKAGVRQRALPAPALVYRVIALALYMHASH